MWPNTAHDEMGDRVAEDVIKKLCIHWAVNTSSEKLLQTCRPAELELSQHISTTFLPMLNPMWHVIDTWQPQATSMALTSSIVCVLSSGTRLHFWRVGTTVTILPADVAAVAVAAFLFSAAFTVVAARLESCVRWSFCAIWSWCNHRSATYSIGAVRSRGRMARIRWALWNAWVLIKYTSRGLCSMYISVMLDSIHSCRTAGFPNNVQPAWQQSCWTLYSKSTAYNVMP